MCNKGKTEKEIWHRSHDLASKYLPSILSGTCKQAGLASALANHAINYVRPLVEECEGLELKLSGTITVPMRREEGRDYYTAYVESVKHHLYSCSVLVAEREELTNKLGVATKAFEALARLYGCDSDVIEAELRCINEAKDSGIMLDEDHSKEVQDLRSIWNSMSSPQTEETKSGEGNGQ